MRCSLNLVGAKCIRTNGPKILLFMYGKKIIFCLVPSRKEAQSIVRCLESKSISDNRISVVYPDKGAQTMPGVGAFIAAGPLIAALNVAASDSARSGIGEGLIGLGVPKDEARRCEDRIEDGHILISVHADTAEEVTLAREIFAGLAACDICTAHELCLSG